MTYSDRPSSQLVPGQHKGIGTSVPGPFRPDFRNLCVTPFPVQQGTRENWN